MTAVIKIEDVLGTYNIPYIDNGKNVANGFVNIKCPFCSNDPSEHLGISKTTGYWYCWRDRNHRGQDLSELLRSVVSVDVPSFTFKFDKTSTPKPTKHYSNNFASDPINKTIKEFVYRSAWEDQFTNYLIERGFTSKEAINKFELRYAIVGHLAGRLCFPLYDHNLDICGYSGRLVNNYTYLPKYKKTVNTYGVFPKFHKDWRFVYFVEGQIDAMNIVQNSPEHIGALALSGVNPDEETVSVINLICNKADTAFLLDADAMLKSLELQLLLESNREPHGDLVELVQLYGDPGDIPNAELQQVNWYA